MKTPIRELASTIKRLHSGTAAHVETVPVKEEYRGKVICQGDVEVFDLTGNKLATPRLRLDARARRYSSETARCSVARASN
jgi:hypothetical protein